MHAFHAEFAMQITDSRIADAERSRAARSLKRSRRQRGSSARRLLRPVMHPGPGLARLWRPE